MLKIIPRDQLDTTAWDTCVANSTQRIVYGYSWYLDTVLPAPTWKWEGVVLTDEHGIYQAVMPIPLRRKYVVGIPYEWVVQQPFFCQFLDVFSQNDAVDTSLFFQLLTQTFRYGSIFCTRQKPELLSHFDAVQLLSTQTLNLAFGYKAIYQNYTTDRKQNLRRAIKANWTLTDSSDIEPMLRLFRENHANTIDGGVADWAYKVLRKLAQEFIKRSLGAIHYATRQGNIEAGALFVRDKDRIIYLFNAASEVGRKGNARTLLIDQQIRENAGNPQIFDFESPQKPSIRDFYRSYGASEETFQAMRWNQLNLIERGGLVLKRRIEGLTSPRPSSKTGEGLGVRSILIKFQTLF
ncbi:hypothetical protein GCM10028805_32120 [Spirosoma harenae]